MQRDKKATQVGVLRGQPCGGRTEYDVCKERKWGDQTEQETLNGEWLCAGWAGSPGF